MTAMASVRTPTAPDALLRAWETLYDAGPVERALGLLDTVWPQYGRDGWTRLAIGDRDACLFLLQSSLFGEKLQTVTTCPSCGDRLESRFTIGDVCALPSRWPQPREPMELEHARYRVRYRLPCSADLLELPSQESNATEAESALLQRCVVAAEHGERELDPALLPETVRRRLADAMAEQDPLADLRVRMSCPCCGYAWSATLDIAAYLWEELDDWAQDLLSEVHLLARSYAWSERDILAMSSLRRRYYLDLLQT